MARDFNQIRNTNAHLGEVSITRYGKTWAIQYGFDGANIINNLVPPMPTDIKEYLEGNGDITIFACASNIDKLCKYALASFPSIEDLYLFKTSAIVVLEDDLSYLLDLNKIYVPSDLLSAYIRAYPTLSSKFDTIVEDYTLTIPFVGDTRLTSEYVDSVISMLSNAEKNAITKIVIPTDFSSSSANDIAWGYDFSAIVNLDNNIWYGATQYDFSVWTIKDTTQDHILTASVVSASVNAISPSVITAIEKIVVPVDFTSYASGSITELQAFMNTNSIDKLVTTYNGGELELSLSGDIVAKINDIGKTLDEALVYAKQIDTQNATIFSNNTIIVPPTSRTISLTNDAKISDNLVLFKNYNVNYGQFGSYSQYFNGTPTIEIDMKITNAPYNQARLENQINTNNNVKRLTLDFSSIDTTLNANSRIWVRYGNLEKILVINGKQTTKDFTSSTLLTRQALVDLINSLGTPSETKTLTIGATNLAKLTADDIAIATAKNWQLA